MTAAWQACSAGESVASQQGDRKALCFGHVYVSVQERLGSMQALKSSVLSVCASRYVHGTNARTQMHVAYACHVNLSTLLQRHALEQVELLHVRIFGMIATMLLAAYGNASGKHHLGLHNLLCKALCPSYIAIAIHVMSCVLWILLFPGGRGATLRLLFVSCSLSDPCLTHVWGKWQIILT